MVSLISLAAYLLHGSVITHEQFVADRSTFASHQRLALQPDFSSVGVVEGADPEKRIYMAASGTYFGGNVVLTAAHLAVSDQGEEADPRRFRFRLRRGSRLFDYRGIRWQIVDAYKRERKKNTGYTFEMVWGDIAVLEIDGNPSKEGFAAPLLLDRPVGQGEPVLYVGYGDRGTNVMDPAGSSFGRGALDRLPTPLAFYQRVVEVQKGCGARTLFDIDSKLALQGQPSAGDSGGGVFVQEEGKWKYCGITSGGGGFDGGDLVWPFRKAKGRFVDAYPHLRAIRAGSAGDWSQLRSIRVSRQ